MVYIYVCKRFRVSMDIIQGRDGDWVNNLLNNYCKHARIHAILERAEINPKKRVWYNSYDSSTDVFKINLVYKDTKGIEHELKWLIKVRRSKPRAKTASRQGEKRSSIIYLVVVQLCTACRHTCRLAFSFESFSTITTILFLSLSYKMSSSNQHFTSWGFLSVSILYTFQIETKIWNNKKISSKCKESNCKQSFKEKDGVLLLISEITLYFMSFRWLVVISTTQRIPSWDMRSWSSPSSSLTSSTSLNSELRCAWKDVASATKSY